MTDIDKVLEAERSIETMAIELDRMKKAADLLNAAQDQADALLRSSEAILDQAGKFAGEGAEIIQRLRAMDLDSRLGEISRQSAEAQVLMERQLDRLNETLERLGDRQKEVAQASDLVKQEVARSMQQVVGDVGGQITKLQHELIAGLQSVSETQKQLGLNQQEVLLESRRGQRVLMGMLGLNLLILVSILAMQLGS